MGAENFNSLLENIDKLHDEEIQGMDVGPKPSYFVKRVVGMGTKKNSVQKLPQENVEISDKDWSKRMGFRQ